jgi:molybdopterin converting factor small subunit
MVIRVEFFGVARSRTAVECTELNVAGPVTLAVVIQELAARFPAFAEQCVAGEQLRPNYAVNIDGNQFVREPQTPIPDNTCLLIMSADAGG